METHASVRDTLAGNSSKASRKIQVAVLFKDFGQRLAQLDEEGAPRVIDALKSYISTYDSNETPFATIEEFIEFRIFNVGFGLVSPYPFFYVGTILTLSILESWRALCNGR